MRVLLDECLPRSLALELSGHEVHTVTQAGWSSVKNGELLRLAEQVYDALITIDQRFAEGREIPASIALITLVARTNRIESLRPLVPAILQALASVHGGQRVRVGA